MSAGEAGQRRAARRRARLRPRSSRRATGASWRTAPRTGRGDRTAAACPCPPAPARLASPPRHGRSVPLDALCSPGAPSTVPGQGGRSFPPSLGGGGAVGTITGPEVGAAVGAVVGRVVGAAVGTTTGPRVGAAVGAAVAMTGGVEAPDPLDPPTGRTGDGVGLGGFTVGAGVAPGPVEGWVAGALGPGDPTATGPAVADGAADRSAVRGVGPATPARPKAAIARTRFTAPSAMTRRSRWEAVKGAPYGRWSCLQLVDRHLRS